MRAAYAVAIIIGASAASGFLGWWAFHRPSPVDAFLDRQAARFGVDKSWWVKVAGTVQRAGDDRCRDVSTADYEDLYKAIAIGMPAAQRPAMMAIGHCPPNDARKCFAILNDAALKASDATVQQWAYGDIWELYPEKREEIRREGLASKFSEIREGVSSWPDGIPHQWQWRQHSR